MRFFFALFCTAAMIVCPAPGCGGSELSKAMDSGELIRLHVIASSDTAEDQMRKIQVRDQVLEAAREITLGLSFDEARQALEENLAALETAARQVDPSARAEWGVFPFPEKSYGGQVVPAGEYQAVRVILEEGKGQNWWCILFPTGCGVEEEGPVQFESIIINFLKKWGWLK